MKNALYDQKQELEPQGMAGSMRYVCDAHDFFTGSKLTTYFFVSSFHWEEDTPTYAFYWPSICVSLLNRITLYIKDYTLL